MARYYVDCREMPSENNCDLAMAGSEEHLVEAATHAITAHKHEDTPELRQEIRQAMKEEVRAHSRSAAAVARAAMTADVTRPGLRTESA